MTYCLLTQVTGGGVLHKPEQQACHKSPIEIWEARAPLRPYPLLYSDRGVWYCTSNTIDLDTMSIDGVSSPGAGTVGLVGY